MSKKWKIVSVIAAVIVVLIILGMVSAQNRKIPRVTVERVKKQDIVSKVTANGKIQAEKKVDLSALVMGQIVNLAVREGDHVKKGDFLLQIDKKQAAAGAAASDAALQASLANRDSTRALMEKAKNDYLRAQKNFQEKILSEADFQAAESAYQSARANYQGAENLVEQSRANLNASNDTLSKTTVRAPIDGIVTALPVKEGEVTVIGTMNNAGTKLMTISDMSTVEAVLMVDETDVPSVKIGQKSVLTIDAYPNQTFDGVVTDVGDSPIQPDDPDLQGLTTTTDAINFKVRVKVLHPPDTIRPGFSVTADIITGRRSGVLTIPLAAVIVRDDPTGARDATGKIKTQQGVYAIKSTKVDFLPITTGLNGDLNVEATSGLSEGEQIITGPFKELRAIKVGERVVAEKPKKETGMAATTSAG